MTDALDWKTIWQELRNNLVKQTGCPDHPEYPHVKTLSKREIIDIPKTEEKGIWARSHETMKEDFIEESRFRTWWDYLSTEKSASLIPGDLNNPDPFRSQIVGSIMVTCLPDKIKVVNPRKIELIQNKSTNMSKTMEKTKSLEIENKAIRKFKIIRILENKFMIYFLVSCFLVSFLMIINEFLRCRFSIECYDKEKFLLEWLIFISSVFFLSRYPYRIFIGKKTLYFIYAMIIRDECNDLIKSTTRDIEVLNFERMIEDFRNLLGSIGMQMAMDNEEFFLVKKIDYHLKEFLSVVGGMESFKNSKVPLRSVKPFLEDLDGLMSIFIRNGYNLSKMRKDCEVFFEKSVVLEYARSKQGRIRRLEETLGNWFRKIYSNKTSFLIVSLLVVTLFSIILHKIFPKISLINLVGAIFGVLIGTNAIIDIYDKYFSHKSS